MGWEEKDEFENAMSTHSILFFGDSFTEGATERSKSIPIVMDTMLDNVTVWNLGVSGYGFDQTYLRMKKVTPLFDKPHILIGIQYDGINRTLLQVRNGPKPYFIIEGDNLVLKGVPIPNDPKKWLELYPPNMYRSYSLALFQGLIRRAFSTRWALYYSYPLYAPQTSSHRDKAKAIASKLAEKTKEYCEARNLRLTFVLFPFSNDVDPKYRSWQGIFLKEMLGDLNADYINLAPVYEVYLKQHPNKQLHNFMPGGHPDEILNKMIATHIVNYLRNQ